MEHYHQQQIQHNVAQGCGHEEVEGPPKVADGPQHAGTHVVDDVGHHTQEIDPQIEDGPGQGLGNFYLTHEQIALLSGLNRVTVSKTIKDVSYDFDK